MIRVFSFVRIEKGVVERSEVMKRVLMRFGLAYLAWTGLAGPSQVGRSDCGAVGQ